MRMRGMNIDDGLRVVGHFHSGSNSGAASAAPLANPNTIAPGSPCSFMARSTRGPMLRDRWWQCGQGREVAAAANFSLPCVVDGVHGIVTAVEDCSKYTPGVVKVMSCLSMPCSRSCSPVVEIAMRAPGCCNRPGSETRVAVGVVVNRTRAERLDCVRVARRVVVIVKVDDHVQRGNVSRAPPTRFHQRHSSSRSSTAIELLDGSPRRSHASFRRLEACVFGLVVVLAIEEGPSCDAHAPASQHALERRRRPVERAPTPDRAAAA